MPFCARVARADSEEQSGGHDVDANDSGQSLRNSASAVRCLRLLGPDDNDVCLFRFVSCMPHHKIQVLLQVHPRMGMDRGAAALLEEILIWSDPPLHVRNCARSHMQLSSCDPSVISSYVGFIEPALRSVSATCGAANTSVSTAGIVTSLHQVCWCRGHASFMSLSKVLRTL